MSAAAALKVAIVLPVKEGFAAGRIGAIGTIVHRLATSPADGARPAIVQAVIGPPLSDPPLPGAAYHACAKSWWPPFSDNLRYAAGVARLIRSLQPALVEVHNRVDVGLAVARACPATPVVLILHNDPQQMRQARTPAQRGRLLRTLARVVCVSDYIRGRLMEGVDAPLSDPPLAMINAVDFATLPPPSEEREKLILFAGRVVPEKGTDTFVAACAAALPHLPGWRAEVIGADQFHAGSRITAFVRQVHERAGPVGMRGYLPHDAVMEAMTRAAIVVLPSRWQDPCPLVALEAMACGAALITTRRGGLPEIGGDAALYVEPDDPVALARAIVALAQDPPRLAAVRHACRQRVRQFNLPDYAAQWNALRRGLVARRDTAMQVASA